MHSPVMRKLQNLSSATRAAGAADSVGVGAGVGVSPVSDASTDWATTGRLSVMYSGNPENSHEGSGCPANSYRSPMARNSKLMQADDRHTTSSPSSPNGLLTAMSPVRAVM